MLQWKSNTDEKDIQNTPLDEHSSNMNNSNS